MAPLDEQVDMIMLRMWYLTVILISKPKNNYTALNYSDKKKLKTEIAYMGGFARARKNAKHLMSLICQTAGYWITLEVIRWVLIRARADHIIYCTQKILMRFKADKSWMPAHLLPTKHANPLRSPWSVHSVFMRCSSCTQRNRTINHMYIDSTVNISKPLFAKLNDIGNKHP